MKNKTVIRKKNEAGNFTTVAHSILFDTRLSGNEYRILTAILSDADHFNLYQSSLEKRLSLDKKTVQKAIDNLQKFGYVRKTNKKGRESYFMISEYGNLNSDTNKDRITDELMIATPIEIKQEINKVEPKLSAQVDTQFDLAEHIVFITELLPKNWTDDSLQKVFIELQNRIDNGSLTNVHQLNNDYIQGIFDKFKPSQTELKKRILELCDENAGGKRVTIDAKKQITAKTLKFFEGYDGEITDKLIKGRILSIKTSYVSSGHLDQQYQN